MTFSGAEADLEANLFGRQYCTGPMKQRIGGVVHVGVAHQIIITRF